MSRSLPPSPSLEHLKKEAKDLLGDRQSGDPALLATLKLLPRFANTTDADIANADLSLAEAQQALAMDYGYKNWSILRKLVVETLTPDEAWPVPEYYRDYRWSKGEPVGVDRLAKPQIGSGHFKFIRLQNGLRVEQFDANGAFTGICHDPSDRDSGDRKITWHQNEGKCGVARLDDAGRVRTYEHYTVLVPGNPPQVKADIYNADGRLIAVHTPHRLSPSAEDIHVTDRLGKLKVILHHRGIDKGEPCEIEQEWVSLS